MPVSLYTLKRIHPKKGIGAVMLQQDSTVPNMAKSDEILLSTESNYIERELLGLLFTVNHFKHFTFGQLVHIITDHKPLVSLFRKSLVNSSPRLTRMLVQLLRVYSRCHISTRCQSAPIVYTQEQQGHKNWKFRCINTCHRVNWIQFTFS